MAFVGFVHADLVRCRLTGLADAEVNEGRESTG
jgi:hypothetical protein